MNPEERFEQNLATTKNDNFIYKIYLSTDQAATHSSMALLVFLLVPFKLLWDAQKFYLQPRVK